MLKGISKKIELPSMFLEGRTGADEWMQ